MTPVSRNSAGTRADAETGQGLPRDVGVGFKLGHLEDVLSSPGEVAWLEIHAENYMADGGPRIAALRRIAERFPVSCHGVGLSIGSEGPLDRDHLARLARLVSWLEPAMVSEHLAWSRHGASCFNDLLPLPCDETTLATVCDHVDEVQERLRRRILVENPSNYLAFTRSTMSETVFLASLARKTGCGLLLDLNNVHVSAVNLGFDAGDYIDDFPLAEVGEVHLAGHHADRDDDGSLLLIDAHDSPVADEVLALLRDLTRRRGPFPVLIERDNDIPPWSCLAAEAGRVRGILTGERIDA